MKNIAGITLNPIWATMGTIAVVIAFLLTAWPALAQSAQPATPQNLQVIDKTHRSVTIGWDDPGDSSIAGYKILRRQIPIMAAGNFKVIEENTNSTSTQYTDTEDYLEPNIQYVYRVQAVNADDALSRKSNSVRVRVLRWQAPQNLWAQSTARDDGKYDVILTWDSEHADTHLVTGYLVSRRVLAQCLSRTLPNWTGDDFQGKNVDGTSTVVSGPGCMNIRSRPKRLTGLWVFRPA